MIDSEGFRSNVGIVICNQLGQLLWAKRIGQEAWQFPQGGINPKESSEEALFRELDEEVGLREGDVKILHQTSDWLHYRLPENFIRYNQDPLCIGQKQKWFLLSLESEDSKVELSKTDKPEFDDWRWVNYWYPVEQVIEFKRDVYRKALEQLEVPLSNYLNG
ncbi:MAG: RNA pyrophosphohydrolase [SAR86 cluster bacterium]|uniref:RNA pyrophosphohydrolase n=1 Tax=SAR86 cluster bacterium TaxID=2030880 RepID=A0A2A5B9K6_9GAMM|nr:MAG: RNA pyrophosphohydrolase [SAR86 cluster bacterium]